MWILCGCCLFFVSDWFISINVMSWSLCPIGGIVSTLLTSDELFTQSRSRVLRTLWTVSFCRYSGSISICFIREWLKYSEWIWRVAAREGKKVKYVFANTTAEGKKVKSFTSEHLRVSNLINHVTLRIKVKKKYSEWIWRFDARESKKVKSSCKYPVKMDEINPKYENTRKIHRLLTNQNPEFLYKV
jgi:hypothetical protein